MSKILTAIFICVFAAALPVEAARKGATIKKVACASVEVLDAVDGGDDMNYASVLRTNPFEIIPAAGMELLEAVDNSVDAAMLSDMIAYAKKFIGTRYVRGGKSPKGFDCSGFTSYVFRQFGYDLNSSSSSQYGQGEKISRDEVSAGDLLFFTGRNSRSGRVGHVAIAIDNNPETGEITFIHAAISGGIRIDRISAPYYAARFIGARRVL
jgi:cell wall-associated NlpC family hydrolase